MAALGTPATTLTNYDCYGAQVKQITITGTGTDATELLAAVAGKRHVILRSHIASNGSGAEALSIKSGTTAIHTIYWPASFGVPSADGMFDGIQCAAGAALNVQKTGTSTASMALLVATVDDGIVIPLA